MLTRLRITISDKMLILKNKRKIIIFFDPTIEKSIVVINVEKHVFHRDVYLFINKLKNMIIFKKSDKLRSIFFQCLKNSSFI